MFDFQGLINALLHKKNDAPVGDLKSATIWVQELPQNNIHQAQQDDTSCASEYMQANTCKR